MGSTVDWSAWVGHSAVLVLADTGIASSTKGAMSTALSAGATRGHPEEHRCTVV